MSERFFPILISFALILFPLFTVAQLFNVSRINRELNDAKERQRDLENYVCNSFVAACNEAENGAYYCSLPFLTESSVVVYLPEGLCRSCFMTLLFAFQDLSVSADRVVVLSESLDMEVRSACNARGIKFQKTDHSIDGLSDIIVSRLVHGSIPIAVRYNLERDYVLSLFFSDDFTFLLSKEGML